MGDGLDRQSKLCVSDVRFAFSYQLASLSRRIVRENILAHDAHAIRRNRDFAQQVRNEHRAIRVCVDRWIHERHAQIRGAAHTVADVFLVEALRIA